MMATTHDINQARITKVINHDILLYELDNCLRLCLVYVPFHKIPADLSVGCTIAIHNVHVGPFPKEENGTLFGCTITSFDILEHSQHPINKQAKERLSLHFIELAKNNFMSYQELVKLSSCRSCIEEKFVPRLIRDNEQMQVLERTYEVYSMPSNLKADELLPDQRGSEEVSCKMSGHQHELLCPVKKLVQVDDSSGRANMPTISSFVEKAKSMYSRLSEKQNLSINSQDKNWTHKVINQDQFENMILVGVIKTDKHTSLPQLMDQTGRIDCVVCDDTFSAHKCSRSCGLLGKQEFPTCPHLHPQHMGLMIKINSYKVFIEFFFPNDQARSNDKSNTRIYLQFSMKDVEIVHKVSCAGMVYNSMIPVFPATKGEKRIQKSKNSSKCECAVSQLLKLLYKDTPQVRSRINDHAKLSFYATVLFIGDARIETCSQCSSKDATHNQNVGTRRSSCRTTNAKHGSIQGVNEPGSYIDDGNISHRNVTLHFQGENVRWYHMLHVGLSYRLCVHNTRDLKNFQSVFPYEKLRKAVEKSKTQQFINLPNGLEVIQTRNEFWTGNDFSPLGNVLLLSPAEDRYLSDVCDRFIENDSCAAEIMNVSAIHDLGLEQKLVSLKGVVRNKAFISTGADMRAQERKLSSQRENAKLGVSSPLAMPEQVVLEDLDGSASIDVIIHDENLSYTLCLVPGSVVEISRLDLKCSKRNGLHCQFTVSSSINILASNCPRTSLPRTEKIITKLLPFRYLCQVWEAPDDFFQMTCDVSKVTKVCLTSTCSTCGSGVAGPRCRGVSCRGVAGVQLSWKVSCLVEDGTGSAIIDVSNKDHVSVLLSLTPTQMSVVEEQGKNFGGFDFDHNVKDTSDPLSQFFKVLLESTLVRRRVLVTAKKFRTFYNNHRQKVKDLNMLPLSDFPKKTVDIDGRAIETHNLPWLQLECKCVKEIDFLLASSERYMMSH